MQLGSWQPEKRPVLHIPFTPMEKMLELVAAVGVMVTLVLVYQSWPLLPNLIPTHFSMSGIPDGWGGKANILLLPAVGILLIYIPFFFLGRYPHIFNYICPITERNVVEQYYLARSLLGWMKAEIIWLFVGLNWLTVQTALGKIKGLGTTFTVVSLLIIFGTVCIYLYKSFQAR